MASSPSLDHVAYVALGSNLADPALQVRNAIVALDGLRDTCVVARSSLYRTAPWGYTEQPAFINAVVRVATGLDARELLTQLLALEVRWGRVRTMPNGPRILDLDLLLYDDARIAEPDLVVPHPRMQERAFVLVPLLEIESSVCIPGIGLAATIAGTLAGQELERIESA